MPLVGYSTLLLGPSGAGKSSFARSALIAEGSGVVCMAPGDDEIGSYLELVENDAYQFKPFDDPDLFPSENEWKATGFDELIRYLRLLRVEQLEYLEEHGELKYKVLVGDTISSLCGLAVDKKLAMMKMEVPPKAMSTDGATFYTGIKTYMRSMVRAMRALKQLGMHWICTCHPTEKDMSDTVMAGKISKANYMPAISGSYREELPAVFDLVMHAGIDSDGKHYMQWVPGMKTPTKSRVGSLGDDGVIDNSWRVLKPLIERAVANRKALI